MIVSEVAGHDARQRRCALRARRQDVHRHRHGRRPQEEEHQFGHRVLQPGPGRALDPPGRRRAACFSIRACASAKSTSSSPTTSSSNTSRRSSSSTSGTWSRTRCRRSGSATTSAQIVPEARLCADRLHHGEERQERLHAAQPRPEPAQASERTRRHRRPEPRHPRGAGTASRRRCGRIAGRRSSMPRRSATNPPTIVLFTNGPQLFDKTYQRYLLKTLRDHCRFTTCRSRCTSGPRSAKRRADAPQPDGEATKRPEKKTWRKDGPDLSRLNSRAASAMPRRGKPPTRDLWRDL